MSTVGGEHTQGLVAALKGHKEAVYAVAFTADGKHVLTGSGDPSVKVWDVATGKPLKTFAGPTGHTGLVLGIATSPDGTQFATAGADDGESRLGLPRTLGPSASSRWPEGQAVAISPDGGWAAGASKDGTIRVWTTADGKQVHELAGHTGAVTGLTSARTGSRLSRWAPIRRCGTGASPRASRSPRLPPPPRGCLQCTVHPNGSVLYTTGADGTLRHWGLPLTGTRSLQAIFKDPVTALSLSPDGSQMVAASGMTVRLAAVANGQTLKEFVAPSAIHSVAASPGSALSGGGTD